MQTNQKNDLAALLEIYEKRLLEKLLVFLKKNPTFSGKSTLTFNEASQYTGYQPSYLYRLTSEKRIPHYKPSGKNVFFDKGELDAWLKTNRVMTVAEIDQHAANHIVNR